MLQINLWLFLIPPCHAPILMSKHHISWMPHMKVEACTFPLRTVPLKLPRGSTAKDRQNLELPLGWLHISPWLRATWEARAEPEGKVLPLSSPTQLPPLSLLWYRDKGSPLFPAPFPPQSSPWVRLQHTEDKQQPSRWLDEPICICKECCAQQLLHPPPSPILQPDTEELLVDACCCCWENRNKNVVAFFHLSRHQTDVSCSKLTMVCGWPFQRTFQHTAEHSASHWVRSVTHSWKSDPAPTNTKK